MVERPGSVTAAGVLSIIFGSLGLLCGLCGMASLVAQGTMGGNLFAGGDAEAGRLQLRLQQAIENSVPGYQIVQIGTMILGLALAVALLTSGIGLLRMSPSARTVTIVCVSIAIVSYVFQAVYQVAFVMPAMSNAFQVILPGELGLAPPPALQALRSMVNLIAIMTVFLYGLIIAYLATILILLLGARARLAFVHAGTGGVARRDRDYRDDRRSERQDDDDDWEVRRPRDDPKDEGHYR